MLFNEGYSSSSGTDLVRVDLCIEAIRLGETLTALMPDEPEALGLLALMLLHDARRDGRTDDLGDLIPLEEQDRERWDRARIDEGVAVLDRALRRTSPGPYQVQAAIAACHTAALDAADTDWGEIAALYGELGHMTGAGGAPGAVSSSSTRTGFTGSPAMTGARCSSSTSRSSSPV